MYKNVYDVSNLIDYRCNKTPYTKKRIINQNSDKNIPISFQIEMMDAEVIHIKTVSEIL